MFFKLDLIQSYGSGVRRAKKAMEDNKSPRLVYSPDNDTDDYTQVVAYINEEFTRIQEEENRHTGSGKTAGEEELLPDDEKSLKEVLKGVLKEVDYRKVLSIVEMIDTQGTVTLSEAKAACGKSDTTTWRYLGLLINTGLVVPDGETNNKIYRRNYINK